MRQPPAELLEPSDAPPADGAAASAGAGPRSWLEPFHLLVPVGAIASLVLSLRPFGDPDVYWHARLGGEIVRHHSVTAAGHGWSVVPPAHPWTTPEWLSEVVLHGFVSSAGWRGALVFQVLASLAFLVALAVMLLPRRDARTAAVVYVVTAVTLAPYLQPRPQVLSMIFLAWLAKQTHAALTTGTTPRLRWLLPVVWLWAQLHGLWLLAPASIALAFSIRLLDWRDRDELQRWARGMGVAGASLAVGCINPLGVASLTLPLRLRSATHGINEWQPTNFTSYMTWGVLILVAMLVVGWTRTRLPVSRSELVWTGAIVLFSLMAFRNVAPATLLLAPLAADRVIIRRARADVAPRERMYLAAAMAAMTAVAAAVGVVGAATVQPIPSSVPLRLAEALDNGAAHRVLNDYNLGGLVVAVGGARSRVSIDGRADYYGATYISRYQQVMQMDGNWRPLFDELHPDAALIQTALPLHDWLLQHGWIEQDHEGAYSLLFRSRG